MANMIEVIIEAINESKTAFKEVQTDSAVTKTKLVADGEEISASAKATGMTQEEAAAKVAKSADLASASQARLAAAQKEFQAASEQWAAAADSDTVAADRLVAANTRLEAAQKSAATAAATSGKAQADLAAVTNAAANEEVAASERTAVASEASSARKTAASEASGKVLQGVVLGVSAAAAVVGVAAVKMAADFETSTTRLVTSAGETEKDIGMVRGGILGLAGDVGFSAEELSKGMYVVESAGFHAADGLTVLKAAAQGAKAENASLETTTDAVTTLLADYHLKASDAATVMSKLVEGVSLGKTTLEAFAGSLHSVMPLASNLGISMNDIIGALAAMTLHGVSADQATQNLASTLRSMANPTAQQTNELAALGVNAAKLADDLSKKGLTGTLQELSETILTKMGPNGKLMLTTLNTSQRAAEDASVAFKALAPATQKLAQEFQAGKGSSKEFTAATGQLSEAQQVQLAQWEKLYKATQGFNTILKNGGPDVQNYTQALAKVTGTADGLNTALMLTGENTQTVKDNVKAVAAQTAEAGGNVKGWSDIQGTFNQKLKEGEDSLGALAIKIGEALLPALSKILGVVAEVASGFSRMGAAGPIIATIVAAVTAFGVAWGAVKVAMAAYTIVQALTTAGTWELNAAMAANVIGAVVALIVVLVTTFIYLWENNKGFRDFWIGLWDDLKAAFEFASWAVQQGIHQIMDVLRALGDAADAVGHFFVGVWDWARMMFAYFMLGIHAEINGVVAVFDWFGGVADAIGHGFMNVWRGVMDFFKSVPEFFSWVVQGIVSKFESLGSAIAGAIKGAINGAIGFVNNAIHGINAVTGVAGVPKIPDIPHLAAGGVGAGLTLVGENGPEILNLPRGSSVSPNGNVASQTGPHGGTQQVELAFTGDTTSAFATLFMKMVREGKIVIRQSQIRTG